LVRFDDNDYSAPMEYAFCDVTVKGYTDRVELLRFNDIIAVHRRCWDKHKQIFDPLHYLPLLERKPHSMAFAKPFENFKLPGCFDVLRRRCEHDMAHEGTREYIRVLRLLGKYRLADLTRAVEKALKVRAVTKDAIEQFLPSGKPWGQTSFKLGTGKHLRLVQISKTNINDYGALRDGSGGAA